MLNFNSIQKMKPDYINKHKAEKLRTRAGNLMQSSSSDTIKRFIAVLGLDWSPCKEVIYNTGLTQGTISRAAAHLLRDNLIVKKVKQEGRCKNTYYKLAAN
ncbi:MAG TPA: hypothetical protein EYN67_09855 [Flavobacteriales bacterium]|nr:hypothetical protein [Methylococcaceae bacterium]HHZ95838.1 hypothetical protein [Flavobacteriales bacterium]